MELKSQLLENAIIAINELRECETRLEQLQKKGALLDEKRSVLEAAFKKAEQKKLSAIDSFCENKCSQEKVNRAEETAQKAAQQLKVNNELLETVVKRIHEAERAVLYCRDQRAIAEKKVWDLLYDNMARDMRQRLAHEVKFLYAAQLRKTLPLVGYSDFFMTLFPEPDTQALALAQRDLNKLFEEALSEEANRK